MLFQRMEDPADSSSSSGMLKWILNKGYGIGKKMVITGIVVSSAPLVLPPLVVFSAMGVAFSVPFGFVFATYACTNKLITNLLPTPLSLKQLEDIKQGIECLDDYSTQIQDQRIGYIQEETADEIRFDFAADGYGKKVEASMTSVDQEYEGIKDRVVELNVDGDQGVDERGYEEDVGEYLEGDDNDSLEEERRKGDDNDSLEEERRKGDDNDSLEEERRKGDETEEIVKGSTGLLEKIRDQGRREIENDIVKEKDSEKKEISKNKRDTKKSSENEDAISKKGQLTDAREIGDVSGLDLLNEGNTSMNLKAYERTATASDNVDAALDVKVASTKIEADLDEEKIWENIGAMRAIVGYKAPSAATYVGELKALYAFTGVEPPASFKGDSDLDEVNANLKFLMSIVGVK